MIEPPALAVALAEIVVAAPTVAAELLAGVVIATEEAETAVTLTTPEVIEAPLESVTRAVSAKLAAEGGIQVVE